MKRILEYGKVLAGEHTTGAQAQDGEDSGFFYDFLIRGLQKGIYEERDFALLLCVPYFAGMDTVGHSVAFSMYCLLSQPELAEQCRAEVEEHLPRGEESMDGLRKLVTTKHMVMEAMRLYPISPGLPREITRDVEVGGYQLLAKDRVILPHAMSHFVDEHFPDAGKFDVERYSKERGEHRVPGAYAPYGLGNHICQGASMADLLHVMDVALILRDFEFSFASGSYELDIQWIPTAKPRNMSVVFRRR